MKPLLVLLALVFVILIVLHYLLEPAGHFSARGVRGNMDRLFGGLQLKWLVLHALSLLN
jgi:hypothetical protein